MPIPLRSDCDAARVRVAARESKNANQVRRLLALAAIYDGASRAEAADIGGVTRQIEPYRVCRRLQPLRRWSYDEENLESIFA